MQEKKGLPLSDPEREILRALQFEPKLMLRWNELKEKTGLSTRTLSLRLKDLKKKGLVRRVVDADSEEYPPPVYYQLIGEIERKIATSIEKEWRQLKKRIDKLFKATVEDPKVYLVSVLEAIMVDVIFTLYYGSLSPQAIRDVLLVKWHTDIHQNFMLKTIIQCSTSEVHKTALKEIYEDARKDIEEISEQYARSKASTT